MKKCNKCGVDKDNSDFCKNSKSKDGYKSICKKCILDKERERKLTDEYKNKQREYTSTKSYKDKKSERGKKYYLENKDHVTKKNKKYFEENKEVIKESAKRYREENKDKVSKRNKDYKSTDNYKENRKIWEENNQDKMKSYREKYKVSEQLKEHRKNWYISIKSRKPYVLAWRSLLSNTLKRIKTKKEDETIKLLGYSAVELKEHLESLFIDGMTWDNYGEWHIDHIKMLSTFDISESISVINSLSNLRPLWASDNCSRKFN